MANDVRVRIVGDDSSFQAAIKRTNLSSEKVGSSFLEMGKHVATGLAAFGGITVGVGLLAESVKAAQNAQVAHSLLAQQMKNVGLSFTDNAPVIAKFTEELSKMSGFTQTDLTTAFTSLVRVTKDVGKAHDDLATAVDLARLKNIDLATATSLVTKAQIGMVGGLRRVGIDVHAVTTNVDALRLAHDKAAAAAKTHGDTIEKISKSQLDAAKAADKAATSTAALAQLHKASSGAADAYGKTAAGAMDRFKAAVHELEIKLGTGLLPIISTVADKALEFIDNWHKAGTTANDFRLQMKALKDGLDEVVTSIDNVVNAFGGWGNVFKAAKLAISPLVQQYKDLAAAAKIVTDLFGSGGKGGDFGKPGGGGGGGGNFAPGEMRPRSQGEAIAATAATQIGQPYQWGGPAILGAHTDCSGLAQAVLAKNGISVGRTTYQQWQQGRPTMQPQPGDLVFFHMGKQGPEHVGVYIGNDQFIEDPHTGSSVRVSQLSTYPGYVGARTYVTADTGGGKAPAPDTSKPTFKTTPKKTTPKAIPSFTLPTDIRTAMSEAALTKGTSDDLKALAQAQSFIKSKLDSLTGEQKIQALDALKGINDQIQQIEDASATKQHAAMTAAHAKQAAALKAHLDRLKAVVTERKGAFENAFTGLVSSAMAGFDRETQRGLAAIAAKYGAETPEEKRLREFREKRAQGAHDLQLANLNQALLDAQYPTQNAGESDADFFKRRDAAVAQAQHDLNEFLLNDQDTALQDAANASRTAADKQKTDDENAYNDLRDLQKNQLQAWLDEQKGKLETGKTQWADFWGELVTKAGMAGIDTASAFWKNFAAAGKVASGDLGGLTSAQIAEVLGQPGGGPGALDPAIAAALIAHGGIPHLQGGGLIAASGLAVVHRGETVIPAGRSTGDVHIHIAGSVLTERDLVQVVRDGIKRDARNNGFGGLN